ncbi:D-alanyl-D-alanine carboxypeptidase [Metabacillus sp. GX 13764]|uniref:D-alanyl-D-alanine carboxypeptidase family protein n=1 Tax=Metabacillus kandeliae TaxID=2900151 RepID=UPI001E2EDFDF|nr:D-alanyl-D-alanine carboxypeptidase family protein [Metabacillus kandeliae]MCD7036310.1 D-alanyl-D-alanine carboxypeptidase [Metabacillus kandeliae]
MKKNVIRLAALVMLFFTGLGQQTVLGAGEKKPDLASESAILIDGKSGKVLFGKYENTQMYPASITKIATAIYAIENGHLNDLVTVSKNARNADGTRVYLEEGEKVRLKTLIQGLLINSGNDAGVAIAEHLSGSTEAFANDLNTFVKEKAGTKETHFTNPHGLFHPQHLTSASDMAKITKYAMRNREFREIFGTVKLKWDGEKWQTSLYTHHKLLHEHYKGVTGGKNGYVHQAGFTLVTTASQNGMDVIAVTLKAPSDQASYEDTEKLLDYGFSHFQSGSISPQISFESSKGKDFHLESPLFYTKKKNERIHTEVKDDGTLAVLGGDDHIIASKKMVPSKRQTKEKLLSETAVSSNSNAQTGQHQKQIIIAGSAACLLALAAGIVLFIKRRV